MKKPIYPQIETEKMYVPRRRVLLSKEIKELLIAWLVLGFCFSILISRQLFNVNIFSVSGNILPYVIAFLASLLTVGLGFVAHELFHRHYARKFGCHAEFKLWPMGLFIALIFAVITQGSIIFAAPGAVYITPRSLALNFGISKREYGLISLSGPIANVIVAVIFLILYIIGMFTGIINLFKIGQIGFNVNIWLAAFNLIPFGMMDGKKIFDWNPKIWFITAIPVWIITFIRFF